MSTENPYAHLPAGAGPDGGTLLGFLASVGALVAFSRLYADKRVTLHWEQSLGWRGRILIGSQSLVHTQIQALHSRLTEATVRDLFTLRKGTDGAAYATITKIEVSDAARFLAAALQDLTPVDGLVPRSPAGSWSWINWTKNQRVHRGCAR